MYDEFKHRVNPLEVLVVDSLFVIVWLLFHSSDLHTIIVDVMMKLFKI